MMGADEKVDLHDDDELRALFATLTPTTKQVAESERIVMSQLKATPKPELSLIAEWFELLRLRPILTPTLALASCAVLLLLSPLSRLITSLF